MKNIKEYTIKNKRFALRFKEGIRLDLSLLILVLSLKTRSCFVVRVLSNL